MQHAAGSVGASALLIRGIIYARELTINLDYYRLRIATARAR